MKIEPTFFSSAPAASLKNGGVKTTGGATFSGVLSQALESIGKSETGIDTLPFADKKPDGEANPLVERMIIGVPLNVPGAAAAPHIQTNVATGVDKSVILLHEAVPIKTVDAVHAVSEEVPLAPAGSLPTFFSSAPAASPKNEGVKATGEATFSGVLSQALENIGKSETGIDTLPFNVATGVDKSVILLHEAVPIKTVDAVHAVPEEVPLALVGSLPHKRKSELLPQDDFLNRTKDLVISPNPSDALISEPKTPSPATFLGNKSVVPQANKDPSLQGLHSLKPGIEAREYSGGQELSVADNMTALSTPGATENVMVEHHTALSPFASEKENAVIQGQHTTSESMVAGEGVPETVRLSAGTFTLSGQASAEPQRVVQPRALPYQFEGDADDLVLRRVPLTSESNGQLAALPSPQGLTYADSSIAPVFLRALRTEILSFATRPDRASLTLEITPPEYGKIVISAEQEQGVSVIRLVTETAAAKVALLEYLPKPMPTLEVRVYTADEYRESNEDFGQGPDWDRERREREPNRRNKEIEFKV